MVHDSGSRVKGRESHCEVDCGNRKATPKRAKFRMETLIIYELGFD